MHHEGNTLQIGCLGKLIGEKRQELNKKRKMIRHTYSIQIIFGRFFFQANVKIKREKYADKIVNELQYGR